MQFDDGEVLTELAAILSYIGAAHGTAGYARDTKLGRKEAEALSYMISEVHAAYGPHFAAQNFAESEGAQHEVKQGAYHRLRGHYEWMEERLSDSGGGFYLGEKSFADAFLYVLTRWIDQTPLSLSDYPQLAEFRNRMEQDKGVQNALEQQAMEPMG